MGRTKACAPEAGTRIKHKGQCGVVLHVVTVVEHPDLGLAQVGVAWDDGKTSSIELRRDEWEQDDGWQATPGNCFQDAYRVLLERRYEDPGVVVRLAQGYPTLTMASDGVPPGTPYSHAWLELTAVVDGVEVPAVMCIDMLKPIPIPRELFYGVGKIDHHWVKRYTLPDAVARANIALHHGPWHPGPPGAH